MRSIKEIDSYYRSSRVNVERDRLNEVFEKIDCDLSRATTEDLVAYKKILTQDIERTNEVFIAYQFADADLEEVDIIHNLTNNLLEDYLFLTSQLLLVTSKIESR